MLDNHQIKVLDRLRYLDVPQEDIDYIKLTFNNYNQYEDSTQLPIPDISPIIGDIPSPDPDVKLSSGSNGVGICDTCQRLRYLAQGLCTDCIEAIN